MREKVTDTGILSLPAFEYSSVKLKSSLIHERGNQPTIQIRAQALH